LSDIGKQAKAVVGMSGARVFSENSNSSPNKGGQFKTTNQQFTKWIQPAPSVAGISSLSNRPQ